MDVWGDPSGAGGRVLKEEEQRPEGPQWLKHFHRDLSLNW